MWPFITLLNVSFFILHFTVIPFPSLFLSCLRTQKIRKRKVGYFRQEWPGNKCFETHLFFLQSHRSYTVNHPAESSEQQLPLASNPVAGVGWRRIPGAQQRFTLINNRWSGTRALTLGRKQGRQKRPLTENRQTRAGFQPPSPPLFYGSLNYWNPYLMKWCISLCKNRSEDECQVPIL